MKVQLAVDVALRLILPATLALGTAWAEPAPPAAAPTRQAAQEQTALKIAGLVVFVANSCPRLQPDYARFKAFLRALGVSEEKLATPDFKNGYLGYTAAYGADVEASCKRAEAQFGPTGSTLPDLFTER